MSITSKGKIIINMNLIKNRGEEIKAPKHSFESIYTPIFIAGLFLVVLETTQVSKNTRVNKENME